MTGPSTTWPETPWMGALCEGIVQAFSLTKTPSAGKYAKKFRHAYLFLLSFKIGFL
jgi:hypothetical protein